MSDELVNTQRESQENNTCDDNPWDDTLLVKAYERAIKCTQMKIEKEKLLDDQNEGNPSSSMQADAIEDPSSAWKAYKEEVAQTTKKHQKKPWASGKKLPTGREGLWKAGMHCRCTFSGDNKEYEAVILWIKWKKKIAKVRYLGFNDEESIPLSNLKPSHGFRSHEEQFRKFEDFIPPPPPSITFSPQGTEDARNAMLMSWYMNGYHTGFYHGMKHAQGKVKRRDGGPRGSTYV